ncbi:hypothetical protein B0H19DRAFT_1108612 [Mycena capillaripes]|nr:hypothetical protein B0H19DRAFT_1108612 [Mycena capillaripes]
MISSGRMWLSIIIIIFVRFPFRFAQAHFVERNATEKRDPVSNSGLASASWIWTAQPTAGNVAFLKTVSDPAGRTATAAMISMTAVNRYVLWVNSQPIGASGDGTNDWKSVQLLSAALNASANTFAILAVNDNNPGAPAPGLLAAIQVLYSDGSTQLIVSDATWEVSPIIPTNFPQFSPSDLTPFLSATVLGSFSSGPGNSLSVTSSNPNSLLPIMTGSTWIWSTVNASTDAPAATVGFRKTIATPSGKTAQSAQILVAVDNGFTLYVNGVYIGQPPLPPDFHYPQLFTTDLNAASNVFTVFGVNNDGPAGIAVSITTQYSDGSSSAAVGTDTSWLYANFTTVPAFLALPDSSLLNTFAIVAPAASQLTSVSNALAAPDVPSGPFASGTPLASTSSASSSQTSSASPTTSSSHSTPIGAIVGPVVGVLALIAVGLVVFFWLRRRRRSHDSQQAPPPMTSLQATPYVPSFTTTHYTYPSQDGSGTSPPVTDHSYPQPQSYPQPNSYPQPLGMSDPNMQASSTVLSSAPSPRVSPKLARERVVSNVAASTAGSTTSSSAVGLDRHRSVSDGGSQAPAPPSYFSLS